MHYRKIMEKQLRRKLESWEVVHHRNGDHSDNSIENLEVMTKFEHNMLHSWVNPEKKQFIKMRRKAARAALLQSEPYSCNPHFPRPFEAVWEEPLDIALGM